MRKIITYNHKGGVGKTTTAVNLAAGLYQLGKKVLLLDLDPQRNATNHLGIDLNPKDGKPVLTAYELMHGRASLADVLRNRNGLYIIPGSKRLSNLQRELGGDLAYQSILKRRMKGIEGAFDYVIIDCPGDLNFLAVNAMVFANEIIVPMQAEVFSLDGLSDVMDELDQITQEDGLNPNLRVAGICITMLDQRYALSREVVEAVKVHFGDQFLNTQIGRNVRLSEAPGHGQTIFEYDPSSAGASDYLKLAHEIIKHEKL